MEPRLKLDGPEAAAHKLAYTIVEAGEMLSLSRAQLYRLIDLGELKSVKIGRSRRVTARQLASFLRCLEQQNGPCGFDDI